MKILKYCIVNVVKVLVKYHLPIVWKKYLPNKNIWYCKIVFGLTTPMLSPKLSFMRAKDRVNLNIFTVALFTVSQMMQCILLTVQCFYLRRNKGTLVLLSTKYKRVAIVFHKSQRWNIRKQYHKDAPGVIDNFEEPHNIIPHQIDETLKELQMKCSKIV